MNTKNDFLAQLNPQQLQAVQHQPSPLMILAGAGSGKTRVLTTRIIHMIHSGISPHEILAVTFTNKAAREMKDRVARQVDAPVLIGTFHAICLGILRRHAARKEAAAPGLDRRARKLGVCRERLGVGNRTVAGDPVSFGHRLLSLVEFKGGASLIMHRAPALT